jgi:MipA family protein
MVQDQTTYRGSCHCGGVSFRIDGTIEELTTCDCSLCIARNALMAKVPEDAVAVLSGEGLLTLYEWNTRRAKHYFCSRFGIYVFHRKRAAPDHFGVNVFTLAGFDPESVPHRATEGEIMTIEDPHGRDAWPGPRLLGGGSGGTATKSFHVSYGTVMKSLLLACAALLPLCTPAAAQDSDDLRIRAGAGAQLRPEFIGSDSREFAPLFDIDIARGDDLFNFEAPDDNFAIPLVSGEHFSAGPAANMEGSRKNSDVGAPVGKVKTSFEAGAFAEYRPSDKFRVRGDLLKGITGHKGLVGSIGADYIAREGDNYVVSAGPRLLLSDSRYQRAYFGVDPAASLASGLPVYRPKGGIHALGLASGVSYQLNPRFGLFGYARYERLVGDAAKSPIVREYGSRNQMSAGLGLNYTFTVRR